MGIVNVVINLTASNIIYIGRFLKMKYILVCSCHKMDKKASEAFSILFPKEILPEIIKGKDRIYKLAKSLENDHMLAISKLGGKFAYYVELDDNKIIKEYDLVKGKRIA